MRSGLPWEGIAERPGTRWQSDLQWQRCILPGKEQDVYQYAKNRKDRPWSFCHRLLSPWVLRSLQSKRLLPNLIQKKCALGFQNGWMQKYGKGTYQAGGDDFGAHFDKEMDWRCKYDSLRPLDHYLPATASLISCRAYYLPCIRTMLETYLPAPIGALEFTVHRES